MKNMRLNISNEKRITTHPRKHSTIQTNNHINKTEISNDSSERYTKPPGARSIS